MHTIIRGDCTVQKRRHMSVITNVVRTSSINRNCCICSKCHLIFAGIRELYLHNLYIILKSDKRSNLGMQRMFF